MVELRISHKTKKALSRPEFNPCHSLWEEMQNHLKYKRIITEILSKPCLKQQKTVALQYWLEPDKDGTPRQVLQDRKVAVSSRLASNELML